MNVLIVALEAVTDAEGVGGRSSCGRPGIEFQTSALAVR